MIKILEHKPHVCEDHLIDKEKVQKAAIALPSPKTLNELAETFKLLSNTSRLKIIHALAEAELCVCDLAMLLDSTTSAVSHQLRILRTRRLVKFRREGKLIYYSLDDQHVHQLFRAGLDHLLE